MYLQTFMVVRFQNAEESGLRNSDIGEGGKGKELLNKFFFLLELP